MYFRHTAYFIKMNFWSSGFGNCESSPIKPLPRGVVDKRYAL